MAELPFIRPLRVGAQGHDVAAVQGALRRAHCRAYPATGRFQRPTRAQLKKFQRRHGIPQTGVYGPQTHAALARFFSPLGRRLIWDAWHRLHPPQPSPRQLMINAAFLVWRKRAYVHYTQGARRMEGVNLRLRPPHYPDWADCSSMYTWYAFVGGIPDPNGLRYNGYGFTGTMLAHGRHVSSPSPADAVFYGYAYWAVNHVAIYVGSGMVVSHGSEGGPYYLRMGYRPWQAARSYA